jgi:hypothetical protein
VEKLLATRYRVKSFYMLSPAHALNHSECLRTLSNFIYSWSIAFRIVFLLQLVAYERTWDFARGLRSDIHAAEIKY